MKKFLLGLTVMALIFMVCGIAYAGTTATQTFNVAISEINELTVSGNPSGLTISTSTAGSAWLNDVWDENTTYSITTNGTNKKITGQITSGGNMPTNMSLNLGLSEPPGSNSSSSGPVTLSATAAQDLIDSLNTLASTGVAISYSLWASASAGTLTSTSKTITLTLCAQ